MIRWSSHDWRTASAGQRAQWATAARSEVMGTTNALRPKEPPASAFEIGLPRFMHTRSNTEWILVPREEFVFGLTVDEELAARRIEDPPPLTLDEMRPFRLVRMSPFLAMANPVSVEVACRYLEIDDMDDRPQFGGPESVRPIYLRKDEVEKLRQALAPDAQLLSETQWECVCRGGTQTLFFFGDALPAEEELAAIVGTDLSAARPNPFGFRGLFVGEWCRDRFTPTLASDAVETDALVVRGGASAFWPWQGGEWAYCVSAMRMPSTDLVDGLCGVRFAIELPDV